LKTPPICWGIVLDNKQTLSSKQEEANALAANAAALYNLDLGSRTSD
jgi:hypothetical protein